MNMREHEIYEKAKSAALIAAKEENAKLGIELYIGLDCGFALITIIPARGRFVNYLKSINVGDTDKYNGGYKIWYSEFSIGTQSISVHEKAAYAFAKVLNDNGIKAFCSSRLD